MGDWGGATAMADEDRPWYKDKVFWATSLIFLPYLILFFLIAVLAYLSRP